MTSIYIHDTVRWWEADKRLCLIDQCHSFIYKTKRNTDTNTLKASCPSHMCVHHTRVLNISCIGNLVQLKRQWLPKYGSNLKGTTCQVYSKYTPSSQKDLPFIQACIQHNLRLLGLSQCISPLFIAAVARYGLQKFTRLYLTTEYCDMAPSHWWLQLNTW